MDASEALRAEVGEIFRRIAAEARPAGSPAESAAREKCRNWLAVDGFETCDKPFVYSAWPGLYATSLLGALLVAVTLSCLALVTRAVVSPDIVVGAGAVAVAVIAALGALIGRFGTLYLPWMRRRSINLEARRGEPSVWLVAHLDSKSQQVSLRVRAVGVVGFAAAWIATIVWVASTKVTGATIVWTELFLSVGCVAGFPLILSCVGHRGTGAVDNASGVATVLAAARMWPAEAPIGVVLTSGEELGLAGARAWAESLTPAIAINCDGVDDSGAITITLGRGRPLFGAVRVKQAFGNSVRFRHLLPGVLLDAVALADAGWRACTVSRGSLATLGRIHTRQDNLDSMTGSGIVETARVIVALGGAIIA